MIERSVRRRLLLSLASVLLTFGVVEVATRIWLPHLSAASATPQPGQTPFRRAPRIGYEAKPLAPLGDETLNSEGFRGPERLVPKPADIYRIMAVGDSVVESSVGDITYEETWEALLENGLTSGSEPRRDGVHRRYEVINAGVPGYVSSQVLTQIQDRDRKFQPDLVIELVGWNDMYEGFLPSWREDLTLDEVFEEDDRWAERWAAFTHHLRHWSYIARAIHYTRARRHPVLVTVPLPETRRRPFNQAALDAYVRNLEKTHDLLVGARTTQAIVAYPGILTRDLRDALRPPTAPTLRDFVEANERYLGAIRSFAARHTDVVLVDAARAFSARPEPERVRLFVDHCHLSPDGNRLMADVVAKTLHERRLAP